MSNFFKLFVSWGLFGSLALSLMLQGFYPVTAQETKDGKEQAKDDKQNTAQKPQSTLFLLARIGRQDDGSPLNAKGLAQNFEKGLKNSGCKYSGEVIVKPISPTVVRNINKIVAGASEEPWKVTLKNGISLLHMEIEDSLYLVIRLPEDKESKTQLEWIDISTTGSDDTSGKYAVVENKENKMKKLNLLGTKPQTYSIPWSLNSQITKVKTNLQIMDSNNKVTSKEEEESLENQNSDLYFSLTVKNFEGDKSKLYKYIQNPKYFEDVIQIGADLSEFVIQMASMGVIGGGGGTIIDENNNWVPLISQNSKGNVEKAWILFPLTKDQAKKEFEKFDKNKNTPFDAFMVFKNSPYKKVEAKEEATFNLTDEPKWYELPKGFGNQLTRAISLGSNLKSFYENQKDFDILVIREREEGKEDGSSEKSTDKQDKQLVRDDKKEFAKIFSPSEDIKLAVKKKLNQEVKKTADDK